MQIVETVTTKAANCIFLHSLKRKSISNFTTIQLMETLLADLTYLKQVTANSKVMMRLFINSYLQCAPDCMSQLEQRVNERNWPALKKAAHSFKPQVKYMGLLEIIPLIQEVEDAAANENNLDALLSSTVGSEAWNSRDLKSRPH